MALHLVCGLDERHLIGGGVQVRAQCVRPRGPTLKAPSIICGTHQLMPARSRGRTSSVGPAPPIACWCTRRTLDASGVRDTWVELEDRAALGLLDRVVDVDLVDMSNDPHDQPAILAD